LAERIKELGKILVSIGSLPLVWEGIRRNMTALETKDKLMSLSDYSFFPDNEVLYKKLPKEGPASNLFVPAMLEILNFMEKLTLRQ
jgi:cell division GTPase FtsZ